ncbi:MAG: fumarylacetoacetate hydrolase family protein [Flavobacteriia bacterium]|nr:fumarylacetoacetate hydrolase family protein [Flavobacteriia bacterium]
MKIICIARNYVEHAKELNNTIPKSPVFFIKPDTALLQKERDFYIPEFSSDIHYEVEIVLKISKAGKYIQPEFAYKYFDQISVGIDFTARDLQSELKKNGYPWEIAKGFDGAAVVGNFLDKNEFDLSNLNFKLLKNGETVQQGNTSLMIHDFSKIIAESSKYFTLKTGDLIMTGTPAGVGPVSAGDILTGFIEDQKIFEVSIK